MKFRGFITLIILSILRFRFRLMLMKLLNRDNVNFYLDVGRCVYWLWGYLVAVGLDEHSFRKAFARFEELFFHI